MNTDRFKFRVWDKENECYQEKDADFCAICYNGTLHCDFWGDGDTRPPEHVSNEDAIIEQCTGLKDKNGKLIYEGDVIRVFNTCDECDHNKDSDTGIGSVIWLESHGIFYVTGTDSPENSIYDLNFNDYYFEVIGNIHEEKWGIEE